MIHFSGFCNVFALILLFFQNINAASISVNAERGYYDEPFELMIQTDLPNAQIYFTTNNAKPDLVDAQIYTKPLQISTTQTVKAFAFNQNDTTSIIAHTYIFLDGVINASYMNTAITYSETYASIMDSSFLSLPVISISSDLVNTGENFEPDVETSVEMFYANNTTAFQVNCGIETWGGSIFNLKKHFRLEFKSKYGVDELVYPLFNDINYNIKPVSSFNRLLLRSGSQDGLNAEFCDESQALFFRNQVMFDLQMEMGYPAPHGRFVHLFVNQQYEGVYHLMERPDQDFFKDYYFPELEKSEIEVRKNSTYLQKPVYPLIYDSLTIIAKTDLSIQSNFQQLSKLLDIQQTAAYLLLNDYGGNFDWGVDRNNLGASTLNHPYKFVLCDVDLTLNNIGVFERTFGNPLSLNAIEYIGPVPKTIVESEQFKMQLADAMQCHCFNKRTLTAEKVTGIVDRRAQQLEKALVAESARWGNVDYEFNGSIGHMQKDHWDVNDEWHKARQSLTAYFISGRTDTLIKQYQEAGMYPLIEAVQLAKEEQVSADGITIGLNNPNNTGEIYYTTNGVDPRNFDGSVSNQATLYQEPFAVGNITTVKSRILLNGQWSAMCPLQYYLNTNYQQLIINEIHFQPHDSIVQNGDTISGKHLEFIELYNKGTKPVFLEGMSFPVGIRYQFKKHAQLDGKQFLVLASDSTLFAERYGFSAFGVYEGHLSNAGETVLIQNLQLNMVDSVTYQIEAPWEKASEHVGYSLSLKKSYLDNNNPSNWSYSLQIGGTPNQINFIETSLNDNQLINQPDIKLLWNEYQNELRIVDKYLVVNALNIFGIDGKLIHHQKFGPLNDIKNINLSQLFTGIYLCQIKIGNSYIIKKINKIY